MDIKNIVDKAFLLIDPLAQNSVLKKVGQAVIYISLLILLVWQASCIFDLCLHKRFSIDEFEYAHDGWLISQGQIPYRDFFEHVFPLSYYIYAVPFFFGLDRPSDVISLRVVVFMFFVVTCISAWLISVLSKERASFLTPMLLMTVWPFYRYGIEIRPDIIAFCFFLTAIVFLKQRWITPSRSAFASGVVFMLAVWSSQKVLCYGLVFVAAFIADAINLKVKKSKLFMKRPLHFLAGSVLVLLLICVHLTYLGSWGAFIESCFLSESRFQLHSESFAWTKYFMPVLQDYLWLLILGVIGVVGTVSKIMNARYDSCADLMLLGALPLSFLSYSMQRAPYPYSLIPWLGLLCIFASRGLNCLMFPVKRYGQNVYYVRVLAGLVFGCLLVQNHLYWRNVLAQNNDYQLKVFSEIEKVTAPNDVVYDNSGGYVTRPHCYYYFFTSAYMRGLLHDRLASEVPEAIERKGCAVFIRDLRTGGLPRSLKDYLSKYYQPYSDDVHLWGQHYQANQGQLYKDTFHAVREDEYFVTPSSVANNGGLKIDGAIISESVFRLGKGTKNIEYRGDVKDFYILWLPRNGQEYWPLHNPNPRFTTVF